MCASQPLSVVHTTAATGLDTLLGAVPACSVPVMVPQTTQVYTASPMVADAHALPDTPVYTHTQTLSDTALPAIQTLPDSLTGEPQAAASLQTTSSVYTDTKPALERAAAFYGMLPPALAGSAWPYQYMAGTPSMLPAAVAPYTCLLYTSPSPRD